MKNSKGYTLIKILGVIILISIIIVIIIPKISSSIENAKQNKAIKNVLNYINATKEYYDDNVSESDFILKNGKNYIETMDSYIDVKGTRPISGYLTISNEKIIYAKLCISSYKIVYINNDASIVGTCEE